MDKELKKLLVYLDLELDLDLNKKISDHEDFDSLLQLDLITYLSRHYNIEIEDSEQFFINNSFQQLSQLISGK